MKDLKILVVDDDPITLLLLEKRLKAEEYEIKTAFKNVNLLEKLINQINSFTNLRLKRIYVQ